MQTPLPPPLTLDATALGHYMAEREQAIYDTAVSDIFGYHALQLGWSGYDLLEHSRMPNKHYLSAVSNTRCTLQAEAEYLPLAESSVDLICMPHTLEHCAQPQQALREAYRVLVPDGVVILTGVSPVSFLGLRARYGWLKRLGQFQRLFTCWRMRDWLEVLGFEVVEHGYLMHAIPVNDAHWLVMQHCLESWGPRSCGMTGGLYYVIARKRVLNMRVLKPEWKKSAMVNVLRTGKSHGRVQKQLKYSHDNATMDRNLRGRCLQRQSWRRWLGRLVKSRQP